MKSMLLRRDRHEIKVTYPPEMDKEEAVSHVTDEIEFWDQNHPGKFIASINIEFDGEEIVISAKERSPIKRLRRITGYLSAVDNFNDAKRAELADRQTHLEFGEDYE